jgi:SMODS and SLOG-associating 2TM effector domain 1
VDAQNSEALRLYTKYRFADQESWYSSRGDEYEAAQRQAALWAGVLLVVAAAAAAMGTADSWGQRRAWPVVAAGAAALSAAVISYAATYQFDTVAHGYRRALDALGLLKPEEPGIDGGPDGDLENYVARTEAVLTREVDQWAVTSRRSKAADYEAAVPISAGDGPDPPPGTAADPPVPPPG